MKTILLLLIFLLSFNLLSLPVEAFGFSDGQGSETSVYPESSSLYSNNLYSNSLYSEDSLYKDPYRTSSSPEFSSNIDKIDPEDPCNCGNDDGCWYACPLWEH